MKALLAYLVLAAATVSGACAAVEDYLNLPVVHESYSSKDCVRVLLADGSEGDCDDLPEKYHHVWVQ